MSFDDDLKRGKVAEHLICDLIKIKYPNAYVIEEKESSFDIVVPESLSNTVEVKKDDLASNTGNYFVETENNGNKSGLSVTKARWYVFVDDIHIIWVVVETLKHLINEWGLKEGYFAKAIPPKKAYLVPKDKLLNSIYCLWEEKEKCKEIPF